MGQKIEQLFQLSYTRLSYRILQLQSCLRRTGMQLPVDQPRKGAQLIVLGEMCWKSIALYLVQLKLQGTRNAGTEAVWGHHARSQSFSFAWMLVNLQGDQGQPGRRWAWVESRTIIGFSARWGSQALKFPQVMYPEA